MPNVLAHFGVHGFASDVLFRRPDPKWIFLGSVLPDIPFVVRRVAAAVLPQATRFDAAVLAAGQASLAGSLLLAGACAALSRRPRAVFPLLAFNCLLHLLLDSLQIKWGSGVHLIAPFSWEYWQVGWYWPESLPNYLVTLSGLVYLVWARRRLLRPLEPALAAPRRWAAAVVLLAAWFVVPALWRDGPEQANVQSVRTLRTPQAGAPLALDRNRLSVEDGAARLDTWAGVSFAAEGETLDRSASVSVKGELLDAKTVRIDALHDHSAFNRDLPSYAGFALLAALWLAALFHRRSAETQNRA